MVHFAEMTDEERIGRLEHKAEETRQMLLGSLFMAKEAWKEELSRSKEGIEILEAMEKAEESFVKGSHPDRFKRLEHTVDVINQRAKSIFDLMAYISKYKKQE